MPRLLVKKIPLIVPNTCKMLRRCLILFCKYSVTELPIKACHRSLMMGVVFKRQKS
jgi:hypothetical protein